MQILAKLIYAIVIPQLYALWYWNDQLSQAEVNMHFLLSCFLDACLFWSHRQSTRDPGFLPPSWQGAKDTPEVKECTRCPCKLKTEQVHHCRHCKQCVFLMDHHCFFTNSCIGYNTMKPFAVMVFWLNLAVGQLVFMNLKCSLGRYPDQSVFGYFFWTNSSEDKSLLNLAMKILLSSAQYLLMFANLTLYLLLKNLTMNQSLIEQSKIGKLRKTLSKEALAELDNSIQLKPTRSLKQALWLLMGEATVSSAWFVPCNVRPKLSEYLVLGAWRDRELALEGGRV